MTIEDFLKYTNPLVKMYLLNTNHFDDSMQELIYISKHIIDVNFDIFRKVYDETHNNMIFAICEESDRIIIFYVGTEIDEVALTNTKIIFYTKVINKDEKWNEYNRKIELIHLEEVQKKINNIKE